MIGNNDIGFSDHEKLHGMDLPTNVYPFCSSIEKRRKKQRLLILMNVVPYSANSVKLHPKILILGFLPIAVQPRSQKKRQTIEWLVSLYKIFKFSHSSKYGICFYLDVSK